MNLNIGGGTFAHPGWLNLDGLTGFQLTPSVTVPLAEYSVPIVYSSHCLEHLDDATVDRVLAEARRVCAGELVLKLPDFDEVLKRRAAGDQAYFRLWHLDKAAHMWREDSIDYRAAMIFCGFWNDAYGDEFKGPRRPHVAGAYHGPVSQLPDFSLSPHEISASLKARAPVGTHFNHQNAWSRTELRSLLERHGFSVATMDAERICRLPVPTIGDLRAISMYVLCR